MNIIKRNGTEVTFDISKVRAAIEKANAATVETARLIPIEVDCVVERVRLKCEEMISTPTVEDVQDIVIAEIAGIGKLKVSTNYTTYRYQRAQLRKSNTTDDEILSLLERNNEEAKQENSNKNPITNSTQRDYMAGYVSKDLTERKLLPADIVQAHKDGVIHFHDSDYFAQHEHNCCLVDMEDMLQNGTVITGTAINRPKSIYTAANIMTQIIAQVASNQYGGQTVSLKALAPFVDVSRQKSIKEIMADAAKANMEITKEQAAIIAEEQVKREVKHAVQCIQYQLVTLMTTNGQTPFVSVYMDLSEAENEIEERDLVMLIREVLRQRIKGLPNEQGVFVTPAFPKLLYVLDENNQTETSKYWDLTVLAAECTAKRMVPDYISAEKMREYKKGDVYGCMGCRSFLTPDRTEILGNISNCGTWEKEKGHKYYGRFNQGVVTLNLVDVACSSGKDEKKFWDLMEERSELVHRALRARHERLLGTPSDVAPILWQYGALARLKKGETIDKLLYGGYSTISYGYAGLYECVYYMKGASHTDPKGKDFALKVMQFMNDKCGEWKLSENIDYSVYGTPLESTTYKFARCLQKRFGIIEGVTDHDYITNSYHVNVREEIDAFKKLAFESDFQKLSPGGAISYVEIPNMENNIDGVLSIIKFMAKHIMYAEMNTKSDYCQVCGSTAQIKIVQDDNGKYIWECPCCGNRDQNKMNVARRTCGYIGSNYWNQGRTQEILQRVEHVRIGARSDEQINGVQR